MTDLPLAPDSMTRGTASRPLVSVIVPTYGDRARVLQLALGSIYAQIGLGSEFDVETIVVDNGAPKPTTEVIRKFPRTRHARFEDNRGASAARNAGIREARGKYVAFLDDDDLWLPNRLSPHVRLLESRPDFAVAYGRRIECRGKELAILPGEDAPSGPILPSVLVDCPVHMVTALVPRAALERVGEFDETLPGFAEDRDMLARLAHHFPFLFIPEVAAIRYPSQQARPWGDIVPMVIERGIALLPESPEHDATRRLARARAAMLRPRTEEVRGDLDEMRRELVQAVGSFPWMVGEPWARTQIKWQVRLFATSATSPVRAAKAFVKDLRRAAATGGLPHRLRARALLADVWTEVALGLAQRQDVPGAGGAAVRAILENPLKPLARPGLFRWVARALVPAPLRSGPRPSAIPGRTLQ